MTDSERAEGIMVESPRSIKLVHVTTVPQSFVFLYGQMRYLKARGFEVHAISSPGDWSKLHGQDVVMHVVPMARAITPLSDLAALWRLWRLFHTIKPDIVHSHTPKAGLLGTLAARIAGVKVVFLSVFGLVQMTRAGLVRRVLDSTTRLACALADHVWCDSFSMRDYLAEAGLCPPSKVVVFGHGSAKGVDALRVFSPKAQGLEARTAIRGLYGIPPDACLLGFVGRIVGDKGMHELAISWRVLRDQYPHLHLLMVGSQESKDPLLAEDQRLFHTDPRIHLAGQRDDVAAHLAAMDVFVMPSYREGFGLSNVEAAAMELPVVSTRIPGCIDSVDDGVTGTLVPAREASALSSVIRMYLDDLELRRRHGLAGRERVLRDFRPEDIWEATYQEYVRLLREKGLPIPVPAEDQP